MAIFTNDTANPTRAGPYFDITFTPIDGTEVDASTILDAQDDPNDPFGAEFTLSGAQSQNLVFVAVYNLGNNTFRYLYQGQLDTGVMEVQFIEGAWADTAGNLGQASTSAIKILTEAESFFIEISGGIVLNSGGFLDEPIIELSGEIIMEFDTTRSVFQLDFNAQLALYKLGSVGAVAGRFVVDNSGTVSDNVQIWGVAALLFNVSKNVTILFDCSKTYCMRLYLDVLEHKRVSLDCSQTYSMGLSPFISKYPIFAIHIPEMLLFEN